VKLLILIFVHALPGMCVSEIYHKHKMVNPRSKPSS